MSRPQQNIKCTLIPGDGVGPELAECVKAVFSAISVPIDFEEVFLSEIHHTISAPLETAIDSVKKNGICLKGTLETPLNSLTGELQAWNMKIRFVKYIIKKHSSNACSKFLVK